VVAEQRENRIETLFPDDRRRGAGRNYSLRKGKIPKHTAFFASGAEHNERAFMAANPPLEQRRKRFLSNDAARGSDHYSACRRETN
jgi:hypothetical protein